MTLTLDIQKNLENFTLNVSLTCRSGTLTAVVGPSGAGKSTLMRIISGLEQPDRGIVQLNEHVWNNTEAGISISPQQRGLGFVFQEYTLFPHLTVYENVQFAAADKECARNLLVRFGIDHLAGRKPAKISGGERQRVAICQSLASQPVLLLLDEPFSALDIGTRTSLRAEITKLKQHLSIPILHITHDLEEAFILADEIFVMENGRASPQWLSRQQGRAEMTSQYEQDYGSIH